MANHSSILAWRIPWAESAGLQSMGSQRVGYNRAHRYCMVIYPDTERAREREGHIWMHVCMCVYQSLAKAFFKLSNKNTCPLSAILFLLSRS